MNRPLIVKPHTAFLLILTLFMFQSCTKEQSPPSQRDEYHISNEFKRYTAFQKGSYWVYQLLNTESTIIDTVWVEGTKFENRIHTLGSVQYFYDAIELTLSSKEIGLIKGEITSGPALSPGQKAETYRVYFNDGKYLSVFIPYHPLDSLVHLGGVEGDYSNMAFSSQLAINQKLYNDVYETRIISEPGTAQSVMHEYFFAKDVGCVKFSYQSAGQPTKEEWVLVSSTLIPLE